MLVYGANTIAAAFIMPSCNKIAAFGYGVTDPSPAPDFLLVDGLMHSNYITLVVYMS